MKVKTNYTNKIKNYKLWILLASAFYSGFFPFASGTFGSMAALLPAYILSILIPYNTYTIIILVLSILSIPLGAVICQKGEDIWGPDNGKIVFDEFGGMLISILFIPPTILNYILAFLAFRFFDIVKLPPARFFDTKWQNGWGVMLDDVFAAIYANISIQIAVIIIAKFNLNQYFPF